MHKVISGGQTGADRIGLEVAKSMGINTGGHAPWQYKTENGSDYTLKSFGLITTPSGGYIARTLLNVRNSTGTVLFGNMNSPGSLQTIRFCENNHKPYICNPENGGVLAQWINDNEVGVLNVAGNRGSKLDSIKQTAIAEVLIDAFTILGYKS